jgi:hypothetical protein
MGCQPSAVSHQPSAISRQLSGKAFNDKVRKGTEASFLMVMTDG